MTAAHTHGTDAGTESEQAGLALVATAYEQAAVLESQVARKKKEIGELTEQADRLSCMQLGLMLRALAPQAARAGLEWANCAWHLDVDQVMDAAGNRLPIDRDSAVWAQAEDGIDVAISQLSTAIATRPVIQFQDDHGIEEGETTLVEF